MFENYWIGEAENIDCGKKCSVQQPWPCRVPLIALCSKVSCCIRGLSVVRPSVVFKWHPSYATEPKSTKLYSHVITDSFKCFHFDLLSISHPEGKTSRLIAECFLGYSIECLGAILVVKAWPKEGRACVYYMTIVWKSHGPISGWFHSYIFLGDSLVRR